MRNVTIKTLAKELNVSVATVSKALKDSYEIGPATKQRVMDLARRLNYVPNAYAGSLRKRKSKTIAIVLPEVADSFFSLAINGIEAMAQEKGYHVLVYLTHESFEKERAILKDFQSGRVDGVLLSVTAETTTSQHVRDLCETGMPVVFFDRVCEDVNTAHVTTNDFEAGYNAAAHLLERGCKHLALLSISNSLSISNNRLAGCQKAVAETGEGCRSSVVELCHKEAAKNQAVVAELLKNYGRPDGIIVTVEKLIAPVYLACNQAGLSVPADVKIVGFSNLPTAPILQPSLTTVTQPAFEMGKTAAAILLESLARPGISPAKKNAVISSSLDVRASSQ